MPPGPTGCGANRRGRIARPSEGSGAADAPTPAALLPGGGRPQHDGVCLTTVRRRRRRRLKGRSQPSSNRRGKPRPSPTSAPQPVGSGGRVARKLPEGSASVSSFLPHFACWILKTCRYRQKRYDYVRFIRLPMPGSSCSICRKKCGCTDGAGLIFWRGPAPLKRSGGRFAAQVSMVKSDLRHLCY